MSLRGPHGSAEGGRAAHLDGAVGPQAVLLQLRVVEVVAHVEAQDVGYALGAAREAGAVHVNRRDKWTCKSKASSLGSRL
jgi:hypothetical protein